ncbi:universal stress protein [Parapedobacter koreensis]|uniref:Nucleotide-binding universal stress protein, UspA family n=1 Tax=Parapedobacter koreensis TaxID=332977 RepID=A0A1H7I2M9_9SPHI|nr:universal stress protein [Parapedobacter koreensis]SEK56761.1 Nucleotide-binding universal stress protein, UspA family [Parapedobacter koreensis]
MKRILCPFDFSDVAENAVKYACHLAKDLNMAVSLLYIEQIPTWQGSFPVDGGFLPYIDDQAGNAEDRLRSFAADVQQRFGVSCTYEVKIDAHTLADALGKEIAAGDFEFVVMGTHGAADAFDKLLGTNTYQAIRKTNKPFLLVPKYAAFKPLSRILYATDYCPEDHRNVKHLLALAAPYKPQLTVFHISKKGTVVSDELFRCFRDVLEDELGNKRPIEFKRMVGDDVPQLLQEAMESEDLLVLLTKHYNILERVVHRSTIRKLSFLADFPILIYPYTMDIA